MLAVDHDKVLLVVEQESAARCLRDALQNSNRLKLVWLARDSDGAVSYLEGSGDYQDREKYPEPQLVVTGLPASAASKVLRAARGLARCPLVVQLTPTHDISQSLRAMRDGADCSQGQPKGRGETIAFVDWLEDWIQTLKGPGKQMSRAVFKVAGGLLALGQQAMSRMARPRPLVEEPVEVSGQTVLSE